MSVFSSKDDLLSPRVALNSEMNGSIGHGTAAHEREAEGDFGGDCEPGTGLFATAVARWFLTGLDGWAVHLDRFRPDGYSRGGPADPSSSSRRPLMDEIMRNLAPPLGVGLVTLTAWVWARGAHRRARAACAARAASGGVTVAIRSMSLLEPEAADG